VDAPFMDTIRIEGLELRCIVGVRSYERRREQPLRVDVRLGLDLRAAARSGRISDTADYSRVADEITALFRFREYQLLEVAAEEAAAMILGVHPAVLEATVRIDKPQALAGRARTASVEITRPREFAAPEVFADGERQKLLQTSEAFLEVLRVLPGRSVTVPSGPRRLEWLLAGTSDDHEPAPGRTVTDAPSSSSYVNSGPRTLEIFRCVANESTGRPFGESESL
jgi:dihydroneopterin aldolase